MVSVIIKEIPSVPQSPPAHSVVSFSLHASSLDLMLSSILSTWRF